MVNEKKSMLVYMASGIIVGIISYYPYTYLNSSLIPLVLAVTVLIGMFYALKKIMKSNEKISWFMSNGGWLYIFIWFIIWTIMYNVM